MSPDLQQHKIGLRPLLAAQTPKTTLAVIHLLWFDKENNA